ncbi:hypothetical protein OBBRIDRAFT_138632 [Obba rivulosa]|uniref:Uncharacterized protein n=1 Tax=Obba rivulosa TaxID=1052685 RepID=A0A8E2DM67_9APHY|nr:hypothetical protein OBBRIDRAFT_138632 [Obba rivulosa]
MYGVATEFRMTREQADDLFWASRGYPRPSDEYPSPLNRSGGQSSRLGTMAPVLRSSSSRARNTPRSGDAYRFISTPNSTAERASRYRQIVPRSDPMQDIGRNVGWSTDRGMSVVLLSIHHSPTTPANAGPVSRYTSPSSTPPNIAAPHRSRQIAATIDPAYGWTPRQLTPMTDIQGFGTDNAQGAGLGGEWHMGGSREGLSDDEGSMGSNMRGDVTNGAL